MKLLAFVLFLLISNAVFAFKYSPMSLTLTPNDGLKSSNVFLENDSSSPIAIQLSLAKRIMDLNGKEENPEELENLDAYPNQLIIPAFEKRSVKISWQGKSLGKEELSFRVIAEQLPLDVDKTNKKKGNVKILLKYIGALYVDPGNCQSKVELVKFNVLEKKIVFEFENTGSKHQVITNLKLVISKKNEKDIILEAKSLKNFTGENILPKSKRVFEIEKDETLKKIDSAYKVSFSFDQE
jgi:fimbrial chaperone protein